MPAVPPSARRTVRAAAVLAAVLMTSACGGSADDGEAPTEPTSGPTGSSSGQTSAEPSTQPSQGEPSPGTTAAAAADVSRSDLDVGAPEGWTVWQVDRLVLAVPPGFEPSADNSIPSSTVTFVPPPNDDGETLGALAVFVETGAVGPLAVRTDVLEDIRSDQTGTEPLEPAAELDVPGAVGATTLRYQYDIDVPETGRSTDSLQVDVTVQMPDPGPQYGAFLSASTEIVSTEDLDAFTGSLRVVDEPADA